LVVAPAVLSTSVPKILGTPRVGGSTLNLTYADWTAGTTMSYQWQRNGVNIPGATSAKYAPTAKDRGQSIRLRITGTKPGYQTRTKYSAAVKPATGILSGSTPKITGTPRVGTILKAVPGTWTAGTTLKFQWQRNGVNIPGATSASYRPTAKDRAATIGVRVSGTKTGYTPTSKTSVRVRVR
jgi:serine protease